MEAGAGWDLGTKVQRFPGGHDSRGEPLAMLDMAELERVVEEMVPQVDSMVVSGLFSPRTPTRRRTSRRWCRGSMAYRWSQGMS